MAFARTSATSSSANCSDALLAARRCSSCSFRLRSTRCRWRWISALIKSADFSSSTGLISGFADAGGFA